MQQIILLVVFIAEFFTTPTNVLFYDQPEYLNIVSAHSFWQVFSLGHFPIHPVFLGILWIATKFISGNLVAFLFGIITTFFVYKIAKLTFEKEKYIIPVIFFSLFPIVWMINTNLMIESVSLAFYAASLYFFLSKKTYVFLITLFLMIGIHIETISWIPTIFIFPIIFGDEIRIKKKEVIKFIKLSLIPIFLSICFYGVIYYFFRKDIGGSTEQINAFTSFGIIRMIRNDWVSFIYSFGSLTFFVLAFLLFKNIRKRSVWISWFIFFGAICLNGAYWEGDLMQRRIVYAAIILSFAIFKYLKQKSIFVILYLIPIVVANGVLYFRGNQQIQLSLMQKRINKIPTGEVLIESGYYHPFVKYEGTILWIGSNDLDKIDNFLKSGKRVFMEKNAITSPYMLFVGNNYHITSLGKVGNSESRFLFEKYEIDSYGENLELKKFNGKEISKVAGEAVVAYKPGFWGRLNRFRINYGDIGAWIWAVATNHHDPVSWIYKDVRGIWLQI